VYLYTKVGLRQHQHVQCVYKDWEKGQWLPTVACAILKQLTKQPMKEDFKSGYVDQITQNVIALLHICHLKNLNQNQSYRSVKIKKLRCVVESRPVCVAEP
jgi:hypothetical protein